MFLSRPSFADHVADPDLPETPELADPTRGYRVALVVRAAVEDADRRDFFLLVPAEAQPIPHLHRPREHADESYFLPSSAPLDLEDGPGDGVFDIAFRGGQELRDPVDQRPYARSRYRRTEEDGMHERPAALRRELAAQPAVRDRPLVVDVRGEQRVVAFGEHVDKPGGEAPVGGAVGPEAGAASPQLLDRAHRDDGWGQPRGDAAQHAVVPGAFAVDLVHEDQGGDAQPAQRPHQHDGLRLHALHGRDHEHRAVEHAEHPLDLGDEIRVAGRVYEVDRDAINDERDDGRLDRDAALLF